MNFKYSVGDIFESDYRDYPFIVVQRLGLPYYRTPHYKVRSNKKHDQILSEPALDHSEQITNPYEVIVEL